MIIDTMEKSTDNIKEKCWQFMNCSHTARKNCIAYSSNIDEECWILNQIAKNKDKHKILNTCKHCPWFLKNRTIIELEKDRSINYNRI